MHKKGDTLHSPAFLLHYIRGITFPATRKDLLKKAIENEAPQRIIEQIENLPQTSYKTARSLLKAYGHETDETEEDW